MDLGKFFNHVKYYKHLENIFSFIKFKKYLKFKFVVVAPSKIENTLNSISWKK